ncbi:MAG: hypothetical protein ACU841_11755 [Gammaproteobacteria bacterium]
MIENRETGSSQAKTHIHAVDTKIRQPGGSSGVSMPARYSIEARAYDIAGLAAHDFWVLRGKRGQVLGQLHGLATNPRGEILAIGTIGDTLKFYHFGPRAVQLGLDPNRDKNFIASGQRVQQVLAGTRDEVLGRWDHAVKSLPYLNGLDLPYTPFAVIGRIHINSNSAYALLGKLMGIPAPIFSRYWQPGWRNADKILPPQRLAAMQYRKNPAELDIA